MSETDRPAAGPIAAGVRIATKQKRAKRRGVRGVVKRVVRHAERLNRSHAVHGDRAVFDNALFPWVAEIEAEWRLIRAELNRLLGCRHRTEARFTLAARPARPSWTLPVRRAVSL